MKQKKLSALNTTCYQLHKSQNAEFAGIMHKVIDFTEHKLMQYANSVEDPQQKSVLVDLIKKYRNGSVAIAWRAGTPLWLPVTKSA